MSPIAPPAPPSTVPVLEVRGLVQAYFDPVRGADEVVLEEIDLQVTTGEFVCLVGPSGSGKTRLLNIIGGFEQPRSGVCRIDGVPIGGPDRNRGIVTQQYSLFPHLTAIENVALGLDLEEFSLLGRWFRPFAYRNARRRQLAEAMRYLERVELARHARKFPFQLSGGMRQRVAIAQALIMKPRILLMDEPFGALDPAVRSELQLMMLQTHRDEKNTIFFVSHDIEEAAFLATRIICLSPYAPDGTRLPGSRVLIDTPVRLPRTPDVRSSPEYWGLVEMISATGFGSAVPSGANHCGPVRQP